MPEYETPVRFTVAVELIDPPVPMVWMFTPATVPVKLLPKPSLMVRVPLPVTVADCTCVAPLPVVVTPVYEYVPLMLPKSPIAVPAACDPCTSVTEKPFPDPLVVNTKLAPDPVPVNVMVVLFTLARSNVISAFAAVLKWSPSNVARAKVSICVLIVLLLEEKT